MTSSKMTSQYSSVFGMYLFPEAEDIGGSLQSPVWHGFMMIKEGIYRNARIKFIVDFPSTFPSKNPEIKLLTRMYHPLISEDGKVDILSIIPVWSYGEKCQVFDLLMRFKKIFSELSYLRNRDSFNPEAAIL